ncbi:hypothetical protein [Paraburkholderia domus]|uniref:hypothetical protein n=1 Tax=Paraburkholderia domus TaxID=2793075 RepID=UPI001B8C39BF|nr:hypothetical protein [Paraburkholderia domus]
MALLDVGAIGDSHDPWQSLQDAVDAALPSLEKSPATARPSARDEAVALLEGYRDTVIGEAYDDNDELASALKVIAPDFEYPNHSHQTVGAFLRQFDVSLKVDAVALRGASSTQGKPFAAAGITTADVDRAVAGASNPAALPSYGELAQRHDKLLAGLGELLGGFGSIDELLDNVVGSMADGLTADEKETQRRANRVRNRLSALYQHSDPISAQNVAVSTAALDGAHAQPRSLFEVSFEDVGTTSGYLDGLAFGEQEARAFSEVARADGSLPAGVVAVVRGSFGEDDGQDPANRKVFASVTLLVRARNEQEAYEFKAPDSLLARITDLMAAEEDEETNLQMEGNWEVADVEDGPVEENTIVQQADTPDFDM